MNKVLAHYAPGLRQHVLAIFSLSIMLHLPCHTSGQNPFSQRLGPSDNAHQIAPPGCITNLAGTPYIEPPLTHLLGLTFLDSPPSTHLLSPTFSYLGKRKSAPWSRTRFFVSREEKKPHPREKKLNSTFLLNALRTEHCRQPLTFAIMSRNQLHDTKTGNDAEIICCAQR